MICHITLPANAPVHQIVSSPQPSSEEAKKDACLKACQKLHELGALTHYLLPDDDVDDVNQDSSDSECDDGMFAFSIDFYNGWQFSIRFLQMD